MGIFGECKPLIPRLRRDGVSVERELAIIQEQQKSYPPAYQQLMAIRFYLQYALQQCQQRWEFRHNSITNYATLIREVDRWRHEYDEQACFVTFNYDTMLESAMTDVLGFKTLDLNSYTAQRFYSIIKLHGSTNWGRRIAVSGNPETYGYKKIIAEAGDITTYPDYVMNSDFISTPCLVPALSIPLERKDEFSCPETHIRKLEEVLPRVTKVLIIGWRATEAEFVKLFHSHLNTEVGRWHQ